MRWFADIRILDTAITYESTVQEEFSLNYTEELSVHGFIEK